MKLGETIINNYWDNLSKRYSKKCYSMYLRAVKKERDIFFKKFR